MFDSLFKKPEPKPCSHPKWETIKEIEIPSLIEQMKLETLPPEAKERILLKASPSDFNKEMLLVLSCPFCGLVKEFKTESNKQEGRVCLHQWESVRHVKPSSFEETCGSDATFEQRMKVASVLEPTDFKRSVRETHTCKLCGEIRQSSYEEGSSAGSHERCAHDWKMNHGGLEEKIRQTFTDSSVRVQMSESVLLSCNICGKTKVEKFLHEFITKAEKS